MRQDEQELLNKSLADAQKIARRLVRLSDTRGHDAALKLVRELIKLGAQQT